MAVTILASLVVTAQAHAQVCPPLTPTPYATQGGALLAGGLMNVRYGDPPPSGPLPAGAAPTWVDLALDVYPHADTAARPLALVLRGGRGTVGDRSSYVGQLVESFGDAGYVVATADYRSSSTAASDEDVTSALRFLTMCHAKALRVDRDKTVIVAEDSAAPVALRVAARLHELRLGRFPGAPPAPAAVVIGGGRFGDTSATPVVPTHVLHGGADNDVPIADARRVCAQASAPCRVTEVPGASHRLENWWPSQWGYKAALLQTLATQMGRVPAAVWPRPGATGLRKRVVYDAANGLTLDAWVPTGPGPHGAVVIVHGGGWEAGDRVTYAAPMFSLASSLKLAWISIDYRLTPVVTNREQVSDVKAALAWIRAHAADFRIDPTRIVLVGESASGQLVTHVAASEPRLAGVVSFYGVYDLEAMAGDPANPRSLARRLFRIGSLDDAAKTTLREFSPVRHASSGLPPMLLIAGTADRLIAQQRAYHAALQHAGARVDAVEIPDAPHGMESWHDDPHWRIWQVKVGDWIRFRLRR